MDSIFVLCLSVSVSVSVSVYVCVCVCEECQCMYSVYSVTSYCLLSMGLLHPCIVACNWHIA